MNEEPWHMVYAFSHGIRNDWHPKRFLLSKRKQLGYNLRTLRQPCPQKIRQQTVLVLERRVRMGIDDTFQLSTVGLQIVQMVHKYPLDVNLCRRVNLGLWRYKEKLFLPPQPDTLFHPQGSPLVRYKPRYRQAPKFHRWRSQFSASFS